MVRRSGLGKGLGALIPPTPGVATGSMLREVPLARIRPNPFQPRNQFGEQGLSALVDSIKAVGILQPVLVREVGPDEYELIAGERRFRAARRAGLQSIPALVHQADDAMSLEEALVENLHREDLNPLDEAGAYQQLIEEFNLTHEEVARKVGRSRAGVTNALRLFQLPPSVQRFVRDGQLSAGPCTHAARHAGSYSAGEACQRSGPSTAFRSVRSRSLSARRSGRRRLKKTGLKEFLTMRGTRSAHPLGIRPRRPEPQGRSLGIPFDRPGCMILRSSWRTV